MNDKKQIEEMAKDLKKIEEDINYKVLQETLTYVKKYHKYNSKEDYSLAHIKTVYELTAEEMINQGYCKILEDSVVLTREEYDKLYQKGYDDGKEFAEKFYKPLVKAETSKEIAKEIYHKIKIKVLTEDMTEDRPQTLYRFTSFDIMKMAREIVEEFGVVIENGHVIIKE